MQYLIIFGVIIGLITLAIYFWYIPVGIIAIYALIRGIRYIRMRRYFASEAFQTRLRQISSVVAEHNDIAEYTESIRNSGSFQIGASSTGSQSNLATFENTSRHGYRRDRNVAQYQASNVHNCSLQVVRNAAGNPLKYLMKYFDIDATENGLAAIEALGESISRLENAVENLHEREADITQSLDPPAFILKHYKDEFMSQVGVELSPIEVPYPEYVFEYVSAGGNSSQKTTIKLDSPTIDQLITTMSTKIKFLKSAAGQRALMTARLRENIKERDDYTCQYCSASLDEEPHLLLEVDHIIPVSRGGLTTEENLQTLCWRCNRSKSNKIIKA